MIKSTLIAGAGLWLLGGFWMYQQRILSIYIIISGFIFMFVNLSSTKSGVSAYSIFNKGAKRIGGTMDAE
jgi:hypothetical protein